MSQQSLICKKSASWFIIQALIFIFTALTGFNGWGQATNDYRSATSGNWNVLSTWERYNGTTWVTPSTSQGTPNSTDGAITIQNSHTVTVNTGPLAIDQTLVEATGQITVNTSITLTIAAGAGTDLVVNGFIYNSGTITMTGTGQFNAGSTYQHARNGGTIPTAVWAATSTCYITGMVATEPAGQTQNFGHLIIDNAGQTASYSLGAGLSIQGDLKIQNTGTSNFAFYNDQANTIGGNYDQTGGLVNFGNNNAHTLTVNGDFLISGGTFTNTGDNTPGGTLTVAGDFFLTSGTLNGGNLLSVVFNGNTVQTYKSGGTVSNTVNFIVNNNAILQMDEAVTAVTGNGFSLSAGATLGIRSADGITVSGCGTGATCGNILTTTRTFTSGAHYIYNGTSAQVTGSGLTANTPANLTIDNSAGVTLSDTTTITGLLTMANGTLDMANTNLTVGGLTGSGDLTHSSGTSGARVLAIGSADTSPAAYSGVISDGTATPAAVTKTGTGTLTLTGNNTFSGILTVGNGTLSVPAVNDTWAAGPLGQAPDVRLGSPLTQGTLQYTGLSASVTNKRFLIGEVGDNNTLGGVIQVDDSIAALTLSGQLYQENQALIFKTGPGKLIISGTADNIGLGVIASAGIVVLAKTSSDTVHAIGGAGIIPNGGTVELGGTGGDQVYDYSFLILNGGIFSTGSSTGFSESVTGTAVHLYATSTIALGTGVHSLNFANSSGATWNSGAILITGWTGAYNGTGSGTAGRIYFGNTSGGLTTAQLARIKFFDGAYNHPATILSTGEIVPLAATISYYAISPANWNANTTWSLTSNGSAVPSGIWPVAGDIVYVGDAATAIARSVTIPDNYIAECATLTIGASVNVASSLTLSAAGSTLNAGVGVTINRPGNGNINVLNVNAGKATVKGSVTFAGTANNNNRIARIAITTGTLTISGDLVFNTTVNATAATNVIDMSGGAGTLNLAGAFTLSNNTGTLSPGTASTFNFNGTISEQAIPIGVSAVTYANLTTNNTSVNGAAISAAVTSANVTGNILVSTGLLKTNSLAVGRGGSDVITVNPEATLDAGSTSFIWGGASGTITINGTLRTSNISGFSGSATTAISSTNNPAITLGLNSTIEYYAGAAQTVTDRDYSNIIISNSTGTKTWTLSAAPRTVSGNFTISANAPFTLGGASRTLNLQGNWTNNSTGTFIPGTNTINLNGANPQVIGGTASTIFNNLMLNNPSGALLGNNQTINGTITLITGNLTLGSNNLSLTSDNSIAGSPFSSSKMIIADGTGAMRKKFSGTGSYSFPIGSVTNTTAFSPAVLNFTGGTFGPNAYVDVNLKDAAHPDEPDDTNYTARYWTINQNDITDYTYNAYFTYNDGDIRGNETDFHAVKYNGSLPWVYPLTGSVNNSDNTISFTGETSFSSFKAAGKMSISASASPTIICSGDPVSLSSSLTKGKPPYTFLWTSVPAGFTFNAEDPGNVYPATNTIYFVQVTDSKGNTATASDTVTVNGYKVSGNINYYNVMNTPLKENVTLELWQTGSKTHGPITISNPAGYFEFNAVCNGTYELRITSTNTTEGSVNTSDAAQVNYWPTALYEIESVRFYAGDVTGSGFYINSSDAQRIQAHFVDGMAFDRPGWTFWRAGQPCDTNGAIDSYPTVTIGSLDVTANFYGLCTGDFNRSFNPDLTRSAESTLDLIYTGTRLVTSRQEFDLPVRMVISSDVGAVSLILNFPADLVAVQDVLMNGTGGHLDWSVFGDELRIGWFSQDPVFLAANAELLTLKLKTTAAFGIGNSVRLTLAPDPLNELANGQYNSISGALLSVDLIEANATQTVEEHLSENLQLACYPNPFTDFTNITYCLPFEGRVSIEINNSIGMQLQTLVQQRQLPGDHKIRFYNSSLDPGIYFVTMRLISGGDVRERTIKIVKTW